MNYTYQNTLNPEQYDRFVKTHPQCNLLQSAAWSKIKNTWGHRLVGLLNEKQEIIAAGLVLIRPVKLGWTVWYMPHGPILDYQNQELVNAFFTQLKNDAKKHKCAFLKIDPPVFADSAPYQDFEDTVTEEAKTAKQNLERVGFIHQGFTKNMHDTIQPRYQAITFQTERPMADRLSKRAKKEIKDSVKKMVEIKRIGREDIQDFSYLIGKTEEAKDINLRDQTYYENMLDAYGDDCLIYIASVDLPKAIIHYGQLKEKAMSELEEIGDSAPKKKHRLEEQLYSYNKHLTLFQNMQGENDGLALIAGALTIVYGHSADILYAGFNRDFKDIPGQDPVFLKSIEEAFKKGASYVNMGGVANDLQDGLMEYKKNFDPYVVSFLGEFDMPINRMLYKAYLLLMKIRNRNKG